MGWIENIQKKPQAEKIRIIWTVTILAVIFLIIIWVFTAKLTKNTPKDTTLFQTISKGIKDFKSNFKK